MKSILEAYNRVSPELSKSFREKYDQEMNDMGAYQDEPDPEKPDSDPNSGSHFDLKGANDFDDDQLMPDNSKFEEHFQKMCEIHDMLTKLMDHFDMNDEGDEDMSISMGANSHVDVNSHNDDDDYEDLDMDYA